MPFDKETARAAGQASGEARRRKSDLSPEERAKEAARNAAPQLMGELIKAATGKDEFANLDLKTRVSAITRVIEYGVGKPRVSSLSEEPVEDEAPITGEDLFATA